MYQEERPLKKLVGESLDNLLKMLHVFCFVFPQECHRLVKCHVIFLYKYGVKLFYVSSLQMLIKKVVLFFIFISLTYCFATFNQPYHT